MSSPKITRMFGLPPDGAAGRGGGVGCACATAAPPDRPEAASAVPASSIRRRLTCPSERSTPTSPWPDFSELMILSSPELKSLLGKPPHELAVHYSTSSIPSSVSAAGEHRRSRVRLCRLLLVYGSAFSKRVDVVQDRALA